MNLLRWVSIPILFVISPMIVELIFNLLHNFIVDIIAKNPDRFLPISRIQENSDELFNYNRRIGFYRI